MKRNLLLFLILSLLFPSCQKREWVNPYDPECPKELFTPTSFMAVQEGRTIKLSWEQPANMISKYKLFKQVSGGQEVTLPDQTNDKRQYIDADPVGGKLYSYKLIACAGSNESNPAIVTITPITNPPSVSTNALTNLTTSTATSGGTVTHDGASAITARGVCWSTSPNPTISNSKTSEAVGTGTGSYTSTLSGLIANTTYFLRAYATNAVGTAYGSEVNFKTLNLNEVADIDGNIYHTVTIGTQVWMAENLKTTKYRNGDPIPYWSQTSTGYCWYNNDSNYKNVYGAIYYYYIAMDIRSICPPGWHIPSIEEWTILMNYLGGESVAGGKLKEAGTTHWTSPNTGATNSSGFTALSGGARDCGNNFGGLGTGTSWYSSQKASGGWISGVSVDSGNKLMININSGYDCNASYVRCLKD